MSELKDLVTSHAWKIVKTALEKRREGIINMLITDKDHTHLMRAQARIGEIDYFLNLPHELIQKG